MNRVLVLLSTFNGEKFLQELLDSLYCQSVGVDILVRDDGSTDNTRLILESNSSKIKYYFEENIGCTNSFLSLIKNSSDDYDYYMFCDQDDVWKKKKVESALKIMEKKDNYVPLLYFSNMDIVDEQLNSIADNVNVYNGKKKLNLYNIMLKSYGYGCTMLFNRSLKILYSKIQYSWIDSHDWLMQKVALLFGEIIYDKESYILYRQHSNNVIGFSNKQKLLKRIKKTMYSRSKIAKLLYITYANDLSIDKLTILKTISESKKITNRIKIFFSSKYVSGSFKSTVLLKLFAIFGIL